MKNWELFPTRFSHDFEHRYDISVALTHTLMEDYSSQLEPEAKRQLTHIQEGAGKNGSDDR